MKLIEDVMTTRVVTVDMDTSLEEMHKIFQSNRFHHLPVQANGKLTGVISDRDVLREISPFLHTQSERKIDQDIMRRRAHQIMKRSPEYTHVGTTAREASKIMLDKNVSCLMVVDNEKRIIGIVTLKDMVRSFCDGF